MTTTGLVERLATIWNNNHKVAPEDKTLLEAAALITAQAARIEEQGWRERKLADEKGELTDRNLYLADMLSRCRDRSVVVMIDETGHYVSQAVADRLGALGLAEELIVKLGGERDAAEADRNKWHRVAMDAGVITHSDGTTSHPMRQELAAAEAECLRLREALTEAEPYVETLHSIVSAPDVRKSVWSVLKRVRSALQQGER